MRKLFFDSLLLAMLAMLVFASIGRAQCPGGVCAPPAASYSFQYGAAPTWTAPYAGLPYYGAAVAEYRAPMYGAAPVVEFRECFCVPAVSYGFQAAPPAYGYGFQAQPSYGYGFQPYRGHEVHRRRFR
jgi:hypothetical protein